jgi:adenylate kinase
MRRVIFLGPPGAGKGTQAATLAQELGIPHLSTGDLLRAAVAARSELGREAEAHMSAGRLVPDDLVLRMLRERLDRPDARSGFLLDGFPRNVAQAVALGRLTPIDRVLDFRIPFPALLERLTQRRSCPKCGRVYNLATRPPRLPGVCDDDGTTLVTRPDDREEAVRTRLKVYETETAPLSEYYRGRGLLRPIDALGDPVEVARRVRAAVADLAGPTEPL